MTWTPETNRIPCYLLTDEEYQALEAAKHGFEYRCGGGHQWTDPGDITPSRESSVVFRAKAAPPLHPEYLRALDDVLTWIQELRPSPARRLSDAEVHGDRALLSVSAAICHLRDGDQ